MKQKQSADEPSSWLGGVPEDGSTMGSGSGFNGGKFWVGRHTVDQDTLVFDPAESNPQAELLSLYSLTQHRSRSFPRSVVQQRIEPVTDEDNLRRARQEYEQRAARRVAHGEAEAAAKTERMRHQREGVIEAHRRYLERNGVEYVGVTTTPEVQRPRRRTKCHDCGIALDDFASAACAGCKGVLCSCGACACGASDRRR
jgi:hypothetical protein